MWLSDLCIRRPVFATMLIVALVVLGLASYKDLGLDLFPKVDLPTITITTTLQGASPEEVESQITKPIEEAVNTINGIDELRSTTLEGRSQVFVSFVLEKNIDVAANEVREKVAQIVGRFPQGTDQPAIEKFDPDAAPIMVIVVSGKRSAREVTEIADKRIKRQLENVKDIGSISFAGDRKREIQLFVDPDKLAAYRLSIAQVKASVIRQNAEIPGGRITWQASEQGLRTLGRIERVEEFANLVVADFKGAPVRLGDVARIVDGEEEPRTLSRLDGQNAVSLLIRKQSGANTVQVVDRIKAKMAETQKILPPDITMQVIRDQSRFIKRAISEVQEHLVLGAILASLVVALFIGNLRKLEYLGLGATVAALAVAFFFVHDETLKIYIIIASIAGTALAFYFTKRLHTAFIAALAIPTSIIGTFTLMRYMGFTLNNLTLLGLSLSVGIVIDDAIIVLENIYRHMEEEGRSPVEAASKGTKEIALAVMATTLSLIVIFLPVAFMSGLVGRFWNSFGLTAAFAIMISLLVAFTLTPMLSSRLLERPGAGHEAASKEGRIYRTVDRVYGRMLSWCLSHRGLIALLCVALIAYTFIGLRTPPSSPWSYLFIFSKVKSEFVVDDDMSEFEVVLQTPPGSSLERSDRIARELEGRIRTIPEVVHLFTTIGIQGQNPTKVSDVSIYVGLKHLYERTRPQAAIMQEVRRLLRDYPDLRTSVQQVSMISGGGFRQTPFNMVIRGPDLEQLDRYAGTIMARLRETGGFVDLDTTQALRDPEVQVHIDRRKASDLGVGVDAIAGSLRTLVGGEKVGIFREADESYNIRLRLLQDYRKDATVISQLTVPGAGGQLVRLNNVTALASGRSPAQIDRYAQERQIAVVSNLLPSKPLGEALQDATGAVRELRLPPQYNTVFIGRGKLFAEAMGSFVVAFALSLAFIYMVLAAQFESFVHPLTIMISLPLSLPFGLLSLMLTGNTINIYSIFGIMLLFGVVEKNAILQVDYTNVLRSRGMGREEAMVAADHARLRPILMTTLTIIAGMLPIALGRGDGSASRASMALVVVGGQGLALILTLLVTPVAYSLFDDAQKLPGFRWAGEKAAAIKARLAFANARRRAQ